MKYKFALPLLAALALGAPAALAQAAPPAPPPAGQGWGHFSKEDMQKHMAQMCEDRYARAVGKLAYLEAKLQLTDIQKPLFERWKGELLSTVKTRTAKCGEPKKPLDEDIVGHLKRQEERLKTRLADLQAQMPALEALVGSLSDAQKHILIQAHHQLMMERGRRMMGGMRFMMMHRHEQGPGEPPPPPSAQ